MNSRRQVNFRILFNLLKGKGSIFFIGTLFTSLAIFVFIPLAVILSATLKAPYEKYDFKAITANGILKDAEIMAIDPVYNVTINGEHPDVISFVFENNGQKTSDKFETLDLEKIANFSEGTKIKILFYQNQAMIKDLKPFAFPVYLFYLFPVLFLIPGIPLLLIGLIPALKTFNLYKKGVIKDAYVVSMNAGSGIFPIRSFQQKIALDYYFLDEFGSKIFGKSTTTDFLILNEKKAGDIIKVFVSEKDEGNSCLIPKLEAIKYNWSV